MMEMENRKPSENDYASVGRIALNHTGLEYQIESLIWTYMKDIDLGHISTSGMNSETMLKTLRALVDWTEPEDHVAGEIRWALKGFETLRNARNSVIHGFNFSADKRDGKLFIEKRSKSIVFDSFEIFDLAPKVLQSVIRDQGRLGAYIYHIFKTLEMRGPEYIGYTANIPISPSLLPARPPEPRPLNPLPSELPKSPRQVRQALKIDEARAEKIARKDRQRAHEKNIT